MFKKNHPVSTLYYYYSSTIDFGGQSCNFTLSDVPTYPNLVSIFVYYEGNFYF